MQGYFKDFLGELYVFAKNKVLRELNFRVFRVSRGSHIRHGFPE